MSRPSVAARLSKSRDAVEIIFGDEEDYCYYGRFDPASAIQFAERVIAVAKDIQQIREEIAH